LFLSVSATKDYKIEHIYLLHRAKYAPNGNKQMEPFSVLLTAGSEEMSSVYQIAASGLGFTDNWLN
jgi:hypothetical protein